MNLSKLDRWSRVAGLAVLLPALLLAGAGVLHVVFGAAWVNRWIESVLGTWPGRMFFSPASVVGGVLISVVMNLAFVCRLWGSWDEDYVALTVSLRRQRVRLIQLGLAALLSGCLLTYAFVENFRVVAR